MFRYSVAALALALLVAPAPAAAPTPSRTLSDSAAVLDDLAAIPLKSIPPALLADAKGIAIIPRVIKAGLVFAGRGGHGIVLVKDKEGRWGEPTFVHFGGGSVGFQVGVESTDVVLVFRSAKSLDRVLDGKQKLTLGADAEVAAGPVGRQAAAATDARLEAEIVSYSRSRGLFAGVSLDGSVLVNDRDENAAFRNRATAEEMKLLAELLNRLGEMSSTAAPAPVNAPVLAPVPVGPSVEPPLVLPPRK